MSMKLGIVSDLHLDFHTAETLKTLASKMEKAAEQTAHIIIAGDLVNGLLENHKHVKNVLGTDLLGHCILVLGNHDFWGNSIDQLLFKRFQDVGRDFRVVLNNEFYHLDNEDKVEMFGGTLWFPFDKQMDKVGKRWVDMALITDYPKIFEEHETFKKDLNRYVDLVVSHHLPTIRSTPPQFLKAVSNMYFVSDQEDLIRSVAPKVWVHGHTHDACDYMFNQKTRIVCNPFGYADEFSPDYQVKIIEV